MELQQGRVVRARRRKPGLKAEVKAKGESYCTILEAMAIGERKPPGEKRKEQFL